MASLTLDSLQRRALPRAELLEPPSLPVRRQRTSASKPSHSLRGLCPAGGKSESPVLSAQHPATRQEKPKVKTSFAHGTTADPVSAPAPWYRGESAPQEQGSPGPLLHWISTPCHKATTQRPPFPPNPTPGPCHLAPPATLGAAGLSPRRPLGSTAILCPGSRAESPGGPSSGEAHRPRAAPPWAP